MCYLFLSIIPSLSSKLQQHRDKNVTSVFYLPLSQVRKCRSQAVSCSFPAFQCAPPQLDPPSSSFSPESWPQQHSNMWDEDIAGLVCDKGSSMCKAGFPEDNARSIEGCPCQPVNYSEHGTWSNKFSTTTNCLHTFYTKLRVAPKDIPSSWPRLPSNPRPTWRRWLRSSARPSICLKWMLPSLCASSCITSIVMDSVMVATDYNDVLVYEG